MKFHQLSALVPFLLAASVSAQKVVCNVQELAAPAVPARCGTLTSPSNLNKLLNSPDVRTQQKCAAACWRAPNCQSFTWSDLHTTCRLFTATARDMKTSKSVDGMTRFWNKACFACINRKFILKTTGSLDPDLNDKTAYLQLESLAQDAPTIIGLSSTQTEVFSMLHNGALSNVAGSDNILWEAFSAADESEFPANSLSSLIQYASPAEAALDPTLVPVHCAIDHVTNDVSCFSNAGSTFYGCTLANLPGVDPQYVLVLSQMTLPTAGLLGVANCSPVDVVAIPTV